ncbi:MAG: GntR family transcriptional regulator [Roseitalea sp.]|jgi:GntR family transcriptional regulator|nr:GntR family transcriptional regulator [Roseitalea sp.]MBO6723321.1 GntR family transcriptional regulator [Roseitalea sp.]MBO6741753.1 GntR family transcriptional regulator [Roseitalea sp.]
MQPSGHAPRYRQLADLLRGRIDAGDLKAGDRLPSETELSVAHGVSRGTVVRAVAELVSQGLVNRRQGSGSYVASRSLHRKAGHLLSFSESVRLDGHRTRQRLVDYRPATNVEARQLAINGPAMTLRRLRYVDDTPCAIHVSCIPVSVCSRVAALASDADDGRNRPDFSLYSHFADAGLAVHQARERVTARLATDDECALFEIVAPAAVIVVMRLSYAETGELVEAVEAVYRADYYTYDAHLVRGHRDASKGPRLVASNGGFTV